MCSAFQTQQLDKCDILDITPSYSQCPKTWRGLHCPMAPSPRPPCARCYVWCVTANWLQHSSAQPAEPSPAQPSSGWQVKGLGANVSTFSLQNVADMKLIWPGAFFIPGPGEVRGLTAHLQTAYSTVTGCCMTEDWIREQLAASSSW